MIKHVVRLLNSRLSIVALALGLLAGCQGGDDPAPLLDLDQEYVSLIGLGAQMSQETAATIDELASRGDSVVPTLNAKLTELGITIATIKADQRLDARGLPSYAHLDDEAAALARREWTEVNVLRNRILRVLQKIGTPLARKTIAANVEIQQPGPTLAASTSTPVQLQVALEQILWCGDYDATTQRIARNRLGARENRRVRALAAHLAARAGMDSEALPVLFELLDSPASGPDGRDLHVLLGLAQLNTASEVETLAATRSFRSRDIELAVNVAQFLRADEEEKYSMMKQLRQSSGSEVAFIDIYFLEYILENDRADWLEEFGYVRPLAPEPYTVSEATAAKIAVLGYTVALGTDGIEITRRGCDRH